MSWQISKETFRKIWSIYRTTTTLLRKNVWRSCQIFQEIAALKILQYPIFFILLEDLILSQFSYKIFIITSINNAADRTSIIIIIFRTAAISWKKTFYRCLATCLRMPQRSWHCEKSVQIRSFIGPYFPVFGLNRKKYGTEKTRYLDTFQVMVTSSKIHVIP